MDNSVAAVQQQPRVCVICGRTRKVCENRRNYRVRRSCDACEIFEDKCLEKIQKGEDIEHRRNSATHGPNQQLPICLKCRHDKYVSVQHQQNPETTENSLPQPFVDQIQQTSSSNTQSEAAENYQLQSQHQHQQQQLIHQMQQTRADAYIRCNNGNIQIRIHRQHLTSFEGKN